MTKTAEIISVGTELLLGSVANLDAKVLSEGLSALGINVYYHTVVGDNPQRLKDAVAIARSRADIIITTGGLGPTCDDLTKQTIAEAFGKEMEFREDVAEQIRSYFRDSIHAVHMTENNLQQAMLPEGCTIFSNQRGTAPGCGFEAEGKHVLMLPGPPSECANMFYSCAVPYLKQLADEVIVSRSLHLFGIGESTMEDALRAEMLEMQNPSLAPYAKEGECMLRITAKAESEAAARAMIAPVEERLRARFGDLIYGADAPSMEYCVAQLLHQQGKTLATAESCTGGMLSKRMTDLPGISAVFQGGVVAYANEVKTALLGVPAETIAAHGAVSRETAMAMARGAGERLAADLAVGITGVAGPGGEPLGRVFVALAAADGCWVRQLDLGFDRNRVRIMSVNHALDLLRRYLTGADLKAQ